MRKLTGRLVLVGLPLLFGLCDRARGDLLFSTGGPDYVNIVGSQEMTTNNVASFFYTNGFPQGFTVTDVHFFSYELQGSPGFTGTIAWQIYQDNGGTIGSMVSSGTTSTVTRAGGGSNPFWPSFLVYENEFSVGSVALGPGSYWLALHNGPLAHDSDDSMFWTKDSVSYPYPYGPHTYNLTTGGPWVPHDQPVLVLQLYGQPGISSSVAEPSTLVVSATTLLLGVGCVRLRRNRA
jgi:hypothetical protein